MGKLILEDLTKQFGAVSVVDHLNLALADGEFVSLLGPSGCGKTTTLRMIAGFVAPSGGTISLDGEILSSARGQVAPERRGMSMIFQSYAVWPHMTVFENVAFGLRARHVRSEDIRNRVAEILDVVRLGHLAKRTPGELSGGQQQRVALARSIVVRPKVLLLDEPLSNLDTSLREDMRKEIRRLHDAFHITTVYVTHDLMEAMATSDRIAVMANGRIEQIDDPTLLFHRPRTQFVAKFIGGTNILHARRCGDELQFAGFSVRAGQVEVSLADGDQALFSARTRTMRLHPCVPRTETGIVVPGRVTTRTFLGHSWEYEVACHGGDLRLRLDTPPDCTINTADPVWVEIDPAQLVQVAADLKE